MKLRFSALSGSRIVFCRRVCAAVRILILQMCTIHSKEFTPRKRLELQYVLSALRGVSISNYFLTFYISVATSRVHVMGEVFQTAIRRTIIHPAVKPSRFFSFGFYSPHGAADTNTTPCYLYERRYFLALRVKQTRPCPWILSALAGRPRKSAFSSHAIVCSFFLRALAVRPGLPLNRRRRAQPLLPSAVGLRQRFHTRPIPPKCCNTWRKS